jgi:hypothetical protein
MTVTENNPHKISTMGTGTSLAAVTDASDFPHTGLIKGLSQMARQNIVVKGSNDSASHDFNITQATSGNVIQVAQGSYLRDGKLYTASAANFTIGTTSNDTSLLAHSQFDKGYHLLVINSSNAIKIRQPTVADKVPDYTSGDTIIAIIEVSSTTSDGSRKIQFLTSDKTDNSVSIAYTDSNTYTEALSISASAGDTTIENKVSDKDIIFKVNDGGSAREILRLDADDNEVRIVSTIDGAGMGPQLTLFRDTADADDNDLIGVISFKGEDSGNAETEYVRMVAQILDESNGTEDSQFFIRLMKAGSLVYPLKMTPTQTIFNAANEDIDVRIDGSADNLFYADSATDTVGIGTTPVANAKLTVQGVLALDEVSAPTNQSAYGQLYANADNDLHYMDGAGTDTPLLKGGKHTIWVPSSAMTPLTTNGCSALTQVEMTAGRPELQVLDFAAGADDFCQFTVAFPKSWNEGTVTFQPFWTVTGTNTGTAVWELTGISADDNYAINSGYPTVAATGAKAHSGTSNDLNVSAESGALTITNASVDSVTFFRLNLKTSASSQTGTVRLVGLKLFYDINAGNDE